MNFANRESKFSNNYINESSIHLRAENSGNNKKSIIFLFACYQIFILSFILEVLNGVIVLLEYIPEDFFRSLFFYFFGENNDSVYYFDEYIFENLPDYSFHIVGIWFIFGLLYLGIGFALYNKTYNINYFGWECMILIFFLLIYFFFSEYGSLYNLKYSMLLESLPYKVNLPPGYSTEWPNKTFTFKQKAPTNNNLYPCIVKFFLIHFILFFLFPVIILRRYRFMFPNKNMPEFSNSYSSTLSFIAPTNYFFLGNNSCYKFLFKEKWSNIFLVFLFVFIIFIIYYLGALKFLISIFDDYSLVLLLEDQYIYKRWYALPFYALLSVETTEQKLKLLCISFFLIFYGDKEPSIIIAEAEDKLLLRKKLFSILWYRFIFWLLVFNFLLLAWVGANSIVLPLTKEFLEVCEFLTNAQLILLLVYIFSSPVTIPPQPEANLYIKETEFNSEDFNKKKPRKLF